MNGGGRKEKVPQADEYGVVADTAQKRCRGDS